MALLGRHIDSHPACGGGGGGAGGMLPQENFESLVHRDAI